MDAEDLAAVLAAVRHFVRSEVVPLEDRIEADDAVPAEVIDACKDMGLYGFAIPEQYGGLGLTLTEEVQLAFELGWTTPALRSLFGTNNGIAGTGARRTGVPRSSGGRGCRGSRPARSPRRSGSPRPMRAPIRPGS